MPRIISTRTLATALVMLAVVGPSAFAFVALGIETPAQTLQSSDPGYCLTSDAADATDVEAEATAAISRPQSASVAALPPLAPGIADASDDALARLGGDVVPPSVVLAAGYARRNDADPLENDVRRRIYEAIEDRPGSYVSEIAGETEIPRSTVRYHVRVLSREGLVFDEKIRGKRRFFPVGSNGVELTAAVEDEAAGAVLDAVSRLALATVSEVAATVDRTPATVSYHLSRLQSAGLIERERDGNAVLNRIATDVDADAVAEPDLDRAEATS